VVNHWTWQVFRMDFQDRDAFLIPCKVQIFSVYNDIGALPGFVTEGISVGIWHGVGGDPNRAERIAHVVDARHCVRPVADHLERRETLFYGGRLYGVMRVARVDDHCVDTSQKVWM